jgi:hypothetical protein
MPRGYDRALRISLIPGPTTTLGPARIGVILEGVGAALRELVRVEAPRGGRRLSLGRRPITTCRPSSSWSGIDMRATVPDATVFPGALDSASCKSGKRAKLGAVGEGGAPRFPRR